MCTALALANWDLLLISLGGPGGLRDDLIDLKCGTKYDTESKYGTKYGYLIRNIVLAKSNQREW